MSTMKYALKSWESQKIENELFVGRKLDLFDLNILKCFRYIIFIINQANKNSNSCKIYKTRDFTENSLKKLQQNFKSDMLEKYIINKKQRDEKVPITQISKIS